jgi:hypothetical protein
MERPAAQVGIGQGTPPRLTGSAKGRLQAGQQLFAPRCEAEQHDALADPLEIGMGKNGQSWN